MVGSLPALMSGDIPVANMSGLVFGGGTGLCVGEGCMARSDVVVGLLLERARKSRRGSRKEQAEVRREERRVEEGRGKGGKIRKW